MYKDSCGIAGLPLNDIQDTHNGIKDQICKAECIADLKEGTIASVVRELVFAGADLIRWGIAVPILGDDWLQKWADAAVKLREWHRAVPQFSWDWLTAIYLKIREIQLRYPSAQQ